MPAEALSSSAFAEASLHDLAEAAQSAGPDPLRAACAERIRHQEPSVRAWAGLTLADPAFPADLAAPAVPNGPLRGVPLGVKDLFAVAGLPTRCGSTITATAPATSDSPLVGTLRGLGAVIAGKTATTEFGYFAPASTANPRDLSRTPGGSSSGSAAAVAAGMVPLALGTQTAGSLIRPASYCGVASLVITHGAYPLAGVQGLSASLDTVGLLARTVEDLAFAWQALRGSAQARIEPAAPARLLVWRSRLLGTSPAMSAALDAAEQAARDYGVPVDTLDEPWAEGLVQTQKTIMAAEAAREFPYPESAWSQLSEPLQSLLRSGQQTSQSQLEEAFGARDHAQAALRAAVGDSVFLIGPAAQDVAPAGLDATGDPVMSRPWQALRLPALAIPGLRSPEGLPLGLQAVGRAGGENALLAGSLWLSHAMSR